MVICFRNFFITFHVDFISTCYFYWFIDRNYENINNASKFCDNYFKWLSKNLAEKRKSLLKKSGEN
jgi:hypothetical protein